MLRSSIPYSAPLAPVLIGVMVLATLASVHAAPLPPESLLRVVRVSEPRLRPDGSLLAFTATDSLDPTLTQIWIAGTGGDGPLRPFTAGGRAARTPRWSPDGGRLLFLSAPADTAREQVHRIELEGGSSLQLTNEPLGILDMEWSPDGMRIACIVPVAVPEDPDEHAPRQSRSRLAILTDGEPLRVISPDDVDVWGFAWSPDGASLAVLTSPAGVFGEWRRGGMAVTNADGTEWAALAVRADPTLPAAFSPDGTRIAFHLRAADDLSYPVLAVVNRNGTSLRRITDRDLAESDEGVAWAGDGSLRTASFAGVRSFLNRIDPDTGERSRIAERWTSPRNAGRSFSLAPNGALAWIGEESDSPGDLFFLPPGSGEARRLTRMNPQLKGLPLPEPRPYNWRSRDGRTIEGVLYLPPGQEPKKLPLIVQAHGGPGTHWSLEFSGIVESSGIQLALNGCAVLFPNPRGSSGYGEVFFGLNRGDLGGEDLRDIEAGIDALADAGTVDPSRVAIAGFSYGGYLAARAVTLSDRYRCALVGMAPVNFFTDFLRNDLGVHWFREYLGGTPYEVPAAYMERSPVFHLENVRTPILIVHGTDDRRVTPAQAREYLHALKSAGKEAELVLYPGEGHGITIPRNQVDFMKRQTAFFEAHLGPVRKETRP